MKIEIEYKKSGRKITIDTKDIWTEDMFVPANVKQLPEVKEET